jgi:DNA polymerase
MLVGEQPGDREDLAGHPFVGPAGRVLDEALEAAGLDRGEVYLSNAVKHFKWKPRGKRRIHDRPSAGEVAACRTWLDAELELVQPRVLVPLGATAAQALLGRSFRVTRQRGVPLEDTGLAAFVVATVHPSSILRGDPAERDAARAGLAADLAVVAGLVARA